MGVNVLLEELVGTGRRSRIKEGYTIVNNEDSNVLRSDLLADIIQWMDKDTEQAAFYPAGIVGSFWIMGKK